MSSARAHVRQLCSTGLSMLGSARTCACSPHAPLVCNSAVQASTVRQSGVANPSKGAWNGCRCGGRVASRTMGAVEHTHASCRSSNWDCIMDSRSLGNFITLLGFCDASQQRNQGLSFQTQLAGSELLDSHLLSLIIMQTRFLQQQAGCAASHLLTCPGPTVNQTCSYGLSHHHWHCAECRATVGAGRAEKEPARI